MDKKYLLFGDKEESQPEETHFLAKIKQLLREALDGLLTAADVLNSLSTMFKLISHSE